MCKHNGTRTPCDWCDEMHSKYTYWPWDKRAYRPPPKWNGSMPYDEQWEEWQVKYLCEEEK
jgi:hypothetical protein